MQRRINPTWPKMHTGVMGDTEPYPSKSGAPAIEVIEYRPVWANEFTRIGGELRGALGDLARRIDHIGSTAVPGLAAKDVIDVQVTLGSFEDRPRQILEQIGYRHRPHLVDRPPHEAEINQDDWKKWVFVEPVGTRRVNLHVRQTGRPNQRYPLLFRDYLRSNLAAADGYALVKAALARQHPDDKEAYYEVKDPVFDIIMAGAEAWAATTAWTPGPSDC